MKRRWSAIALAAALLLSGFTVSRAADKMDEVYVVWGDEWLSEYLTPSQIRDMHGRACEWVCDVVAVTSLIRAHGREMDAALKGSGITRGEAETYLLEKLGVGKTFLDRLGNTKADFQIVARSKDGETIVVHYKVNLGYNAFREAPPLRGFATLECTITVRGENRRSAAVEVLPLDGF